MSESKMLKITGIIMIIGGALMLLIAIAGFATGGLAAAANVEIDSGLLIISAIIALVGGVIELVAGIMGVKNWNKPEKAQSCFIMGIVLIAISLLSNIITIATSGFSGSMVSGIVIGLILPVLYTYGASQLKKGAK